MSLRADYPSFEKRFGVEVDETEARKRFLNRVDALVLRRLSNTDKSKALQLYRYETGSFLQHGWHEYKDEGRTLFDIAVSISEGQELSQIRWDMVRMLHLIESAYEAVPEKRSVTEQGVRQALESAEVELGIIWERGVFLQRSEAFLDEPLRDDLTANQLGDQKFHSVRVAYKHGLLLLSQAGDQGDMLKDTIVNCYEALEAMAMLVTRRDTDLSKNRERFAKLLELPKNYAEILYQLVKFGNHYRHADSPAQTGIRETRPVLSRDLAESYAYFIGVFLRIASARLNAALASEEEQDAT